MLLLVGLVGPATHAAHTPHSKPEGDPLPRTRGWIEARSPRFTLFSEAGGRRTRRIATNLERFREVLARITDGFDFNADVPTTIYVFQSDASFEPYKLSREGQPRNVSGYFLERPFRNYVALDGSAGARPDRVVYHEFVHTLLHGTFKKIPLWLDEGLAEYYSTFEFREPSGRAEVGHPIESHVRSLHEYPMLGLDELFSTTIRSATYNEGTRQGLFYAQSWLLVHYLAADEQRRGQLGRLLAMLHDGVAPAAAVSEALGPPEKLRAGLEQYLGEGSRHYWIELGEEVEPLDVTIRDMSAGDVLYRLGDLLLQRGQWNAEPARAHLEAALAEDGPEAGIHAGLALAAQHVDDEAEAERWFRKAAGAATADAELLARYGYFKLSQYGRTAPAASQGPKKTPGPLLEARRLFERSNELDPQGVEALAGLGKTFLLGDGDSAEGLAALTTASARRPFRADILHDLACLMAKSGRREDAWSLVDSELRDKAEDPNLIRSAEGYLAAAELEAANARLALNDRDGAALILAGAAAHARTPQVRGELERARDRLSDAPAGRFVIDDAAAGNDLVRRFNEAARLGAAGKLAEATSLLESTLESCDVPELCERFESALADLEGIRRHNGRVERYNEAVAMANRGERDKAIEALKVLVDEEADGELAETIQRTLARIREAH